MALTIDQFKEKNPEYKGVDNLELARYMHDKYYSDMPFTKFAEQVGVEDPDADGNFVRGVKEQLPVLQQAGYGILGGVGALGEYVAGEGGIASGIRKASEAGYLKKQAELQETAKQTDDWDTVHAEAKAGDFSGMGDFIAHAAGAGLGQLGIAALTGGVGGIAGKAIAKQAFTGMMEKATAAQAEKLLASNAAKVAAGETAEVLTEEAATSLAADIVANKVKDYAATGAVLAMGTAQEAGEVGGALTTENTGKTLTSEQLTKGLGYSLAAGGLEGLGDLLGLGAITGKLPLGKTIGGMTGVTGRVARGVAGGLEAAPAEAITETGQTFLERAGEGKEVFTPESYAEARTAAAQGAFGGHFIGTVGGLLTPPKVASAKNVDDAIAGANADLESNTNIIPPAPPVIQTGPSNAGILATPLTQQDFLATHVTPDGKYIRQIDKNEFIDENFNPVRIKDKSKLTEVNVRSSRPPEIDPNNVAWLEQREAEKQARRNANENIPVIETEPASVPETIMPYSGGKKNRTVKQQEEQKFELTPEATEPKDIVRESYSKMNREDFANFLKSEEGKKRFKDGDLYNVITTRPEARYIYDIKHSPDLVEAMNNHTGETSSERSASSREMQKKLSDIWISLGKNPIDGVKAVDGDWTNFIINNNTRAKGSQKPDVTHKTYIRLTDPKILLNKDFTRGLLEAIANTGANGQTKFAARGTALIFHNDNIVMHGATKEDAERMADAAEKYLGNKNIAERSLGQDSKNTSYSDVLANQVLEVRKNIKHVEDKEKPVTPYSGGKKNIVPKTKEETGYSLDQLKEHLASVETELDNQGLVKNAVTRKTADNLKKLIGEIEHPELSKIFPYHSDVLNRLAATIDVHAQEGWQNDEQKTEALKNKIKGTLKGFGFVEASADFDADQVINALKEKQTKPINKTHKGYTITKNNDGTWKAEAVAKNGEKHTIVESSKTLLIKSINTFVKKQGEPEQQQKVEEAISSNEMDDLKDQMGQAIGELASLLGAKTNLTEEEEAKLIPIMSKIFRIAAKMGYIKFKDAAKHVMSQIRQIAGDEIADKLSIENLQAGYINIAKEIGGNKAEALQYESIEEIEQETNNAEQEQKTTQPNGSGSAQSNISKENEDTSESRSGIRSSGQKERNTGLIDIFTKLGKFNHLKEDHPQKDLINLVQDEWINILDEKGYFEGSFQGDRVIKYEHGCKQ